MKEGPSHNRRGGCLGYAWQLFMAEATARLGSFVKHPSITGPFGWAIKITVITSLVLAYLEFLARCAEDLSMRWG